MVIVPQQSRPAIGALRRCASIDTQSPPMKHKCFFALLAAGLAFGIFQYFHPEGLSLGPGNEMVMEARTLIHDEDHTKARPPALPATFPVLPSSQG